MKIKTVKYMPGEARFVLENDVSLSYGLVGGVPMIREGTRTYCVKLEGMTTRDDVTTALKAMIKAKHNSKERYDTLNLESLKGTDI